MKPTMKTTIKITIKLFARFREIAGTDQLIHTLTEDDTLETLLNALHQNHPDLPLNPERTILSVNQEFAKPDYVLHDGDEVAIFPPVSGGSDSQSPKFRLTYDPISTDEVIKLVAHPQTGAVTTFTGIVRNISDGKAVSSLDYEAYPEMAIAKMKEVAEEAYEKWADIVDIAIVQRIGHLEVGDVAIAIAVSSPHRYQGCFEACQYAINRLKEIVPIWKKETGPDGAEWVEGDHNPSL